MPSHTLVSKVLAFFLFSTIALAQNVTPYCPTYDGQIYTQLNGQNYTIYCLSDTSPGSYASQAAASFSACIAACDSAGSACAAATYQAGGGTCYLKASFTSNTTAGGVYSAVKYVAPIPYPVPSVGYSNSSGGCGTALGSGIVAGGSSTFVNYTYNGVVRSYLIHIPATYNVNKAAPLIFAFHGRGDQAGNIEGSTGFSLAKTNPYGIAVYVNGLNAQWQGDPAVLTQPSDDIGLVNALITDIESRYCIDTGRIFAAGFSNGGGFIGVIACDNALSQRFNALVAHSGAFYTQTSDAQCQPMTVTTNTLVGACNPGKVNPILELHGTADGTIPYPGGGRRGYCLPDILNRWVPDWVTRNGITNTTANVSTIGTNGGTTRYEWGGPGRNGLITHMAIAGWNHYWARSADGASIDAGRQAINYFYRWTNPNGPDFDYLNTSSSAVAASSSSSSTTTTATATSSTSTATPTISQSAVVGPDGITTVGYPYTCTAINTNTYALIDTGGAAYLFMCGGGSQGSPYSSPASNSWRDCFALCDASAGCSGFSFVNGPNYGEGAGACWLKNTLPQSFASTANLLSTRIAGLKRSLVSGYTSSTASTSSSSTSSTGSTTSSSSSSSSSTTSSSSSAITSTTSTSTTSSSSSSSTSSPPITTTATTTTSSSSSSSSTSSSLPSSTSSSSSSASSSAPSASSSSSSSSASRTSSSSSSSSLSSSSATSSTSSTGSTLGLSSTASTCDATTTVYVTAPRPTSTSLSTPSTSLPSTSVSVTGSTSSAPSTPSSSSMSSSLSSSAGSISTIGSSMSMSSSSTAGSSTSISSSSSTATSLSPSSSSSSNPGASSSTPSSTQSSTSSAPASSTSVAAATTSFPACPGANNTIQTDPAGYSYQIFCRYDSNVPSYNSTNVNNGYGDCIALCDSLQGCTGFAYYNGVCYLKNSGPLNPYSTANNVLIGVLVNSPGGSATTAGSTSSAAPSSSPSSSAVSSSSSAGVSPRSTSVSISLTTVSSLATTSSASASPRSSTPSSSSTSSTSSSVAQSTTSSSVPPSSTPGMTSSTSSSAAAASSTQGTASSTSSSAAATSTMPSAAASSSTAATSSSASPMASSTSSAAVSVTPSSTAASSAAITPAPSSTSPSTTSSDGFATTSRSVAPPCPTDQSACGVINGTTCNDNTGTAYYYQCDTTPTGGTIINPSNGQRKRSFDILDFFKSDGRDYADDFYPGLSVQDELSLNGLDMGRDHDHPLLYGAPPVPSPAAEKAKRQFSSPSFADCNTECSQTNGCIAFTYQNSTQTCTMYSSLTGGYASSPGTQFGLAQPANDASVPTTTPAPDTPTQTISGTTVTVTPPSPTPTMSGSMTLPVSQPGGGDYGSTPSPSPAPSPTPSTTLSGYVPPATSSPPPAASSPPPSSVPGGGVYTPPTSVAPSTTQPASSSPAPSLSNGQSYVPPGQSSNTLSNTNGPRSGTVSTTTSSGPALYTGTGYGPSGSGSSSAPTGGVSSTSGSMSMTGSVSMSSGVSVTPTPSPYPSNSGYSPSYSSGQRTVTITVTPSTCPAPSRTRTTTIYQTTSVQACPSDGSQGMICQRR